jgi:hypothetical protein
MYKPRFVFLIGVGFAPLASGAGFPMPKTGEWKVQELDPVTSKATGKGSVECIETQDKKRWEDDFRKVASENGMDCQLTIKSETATRLAYDIQCKGRRSQAGSAAVQVYSQDAEGTLVWNRQSKTSYTIEQEIKLLAMKTEAIDPKGVSANQKRMMDAAMRHSPENTSTKMKNEYTFVGPKCSPAPTKGKPG